MGLIDSVMVMGVDCMEEEEAEVDKEEINDDEEVFTLLATKAISICGE